MVECLPSKEKVAGSNPVRRSMHCGQANSRTRVKPVRPKHQRRWIPFTRSYHTVSKRSQSDRSNQKVTRKLHEMTKITDSVGEKCLVVMKSLTRCLVIDEGTADKSSYRLPLISEISSAVIKKYLLAPLKNNASLLLTDQEISPWDLLDPFPPNQYYDYAYMELNASKKDKYWELLNEEDKELVTICQSFLKVLMLN